MGWMRWAAAACVATGIAGAGREAAAQRCGTDRNGFEYECPDEGRNSRAQVSNRVAPNMCADALTRMVTLAGVGGEQVVERTRTRVVIRSAWPGPVWLRQVYTCEVVRDGDGSAVEIRWRLLPDR